MICDDDFYTGICPARKEDGQCVSKFPCSHKAEPPKPPTNADRIRAMSDEEMAEWVSAGENCIMTVCDHICGGECNAFATSQKSGKAACKEIVMKWLQQPAKEDDQ